MTHSITFELPDAAYKKLVEKASKSGKRVEDFVAEQVTKGDAVPVEDPFAKFIGAFNSGIGDVGENHDKYIGEAIYREMRGENE